MKAKILIFILIFIIFINENGFTQTLEWRRVPGIPFSGKINDLYFTDANTGWFTIYDMVYKTTDSGDSWIIFSNAGSNRSIGFFDDQTGILGNLDSNNVLRRSTNGGANWTNVTGFPSIKPRGVCGISIVDSNTAYIVGAYTYNARVFKTTDKGLNWSLVFNDTSLARSLVDCYFWSKDSGIVAGGYNVTSFDNGNSVVLLTTNGGINWQQVYKSSRTKEWCWKISFNKSYSKSFGVISIERSVSNGLSYFLKTTNSGYNWTEIPFMVYDQEGIGFLNENTGWIGGYGNASDNSNYVTTDGGLTWSLAGWGVFMNRIRFINDTLAFAGAGYAFKYSRNIVGIPYVQTEIPTDLNLYQNYPNPFNPITLIKYDIPKVGNNSLTNVKITVFDITGKKIRELVNENLSPGKYQVSFDGGYFTSGIYIYKLETGSFSVSKKMVILK